MKAKTKRLFSYVALTVATFTLTVCVSADMQFSGYDTTNPPYYGKIYNEMINGRYTSKTVIDPLPAESIYWLSDGYEEAYPHAGYDKLYLEGNPQSIYRYNNTYPQWEARFRDYFWEIKAPHNVYQRQQTNIPGKGWTWDFGNDAFGIPDSAVLVPNGKTAIVKESFRFFGLDNLDVNGYAISEKVKDMYTYFGIAPTPIESISLLSPESLSQLDNNNQYVVSNAQIQSVIDIVKSKVLSGPAFLGGNSGYKDVAEYFLNFGRAWEWDADSLIITNDANISWTPVTYESAEPYNYYQFLIVNGVVLDGRNDTPRIYRYTGGKASPVVEWRYYWPEAADPYQVVEFKYIDGKLAYDENGDPVYRVPSGKFANLHTVVTATDVEFWVKDDKGDYKIGSVPKYRGVLGGIPSTTIAGGFGNY